MNPTKYMMKKIVFLTITLGLSALSIITYEIFPKELYNDSYDWLKVLGPGISYSFFLISFLNIQVKRIIMYYFIFVGLWLCLFLLTYASWGMITPLSGAASGCIIGWILFGLSEGYSLRKDTLLWTGGISATIGWALSIYSNSHNNNTWGFSLMWIIICWQFATGLLIIRTAGKKVKNT